MDNREFEWDNNKERINKEKHNITFSQGSEVFNYPRVTLVDNRKDYGERNIYDNCYQKDE